MFLGFCVFVFHREGDGGRKSRGKERERAISVFLPSSFLSSFSVSRSLLREPPHFFCIFLFYRSRMTDRQKVSFFFFETWMRDRRVAGSTLPKWFGFLRPTVRCQKNPKTAWFFLLLFDKASFFFSLAQEGENFFSCRRGKTIFPFFFFWWTHTHTHYY